MINILIVFCSWIESAYFYLFTGIPIEMRISCNTSRTHPPERALSLAKTWSLAHFSHVSCFTPLLEKCWNSRNTNGLLLRMGQHSISLLQHKTLLDYHHIIFKYLFIMYQFRWLPHTVLNCKIFIFTFRVNIFWDTVWCPLQVTYNP